MLCAQVKKIRITVLDYCLLLLGKNCFQVIVSLRAPKGRGNLLAQSWFLEIATGAAHTPNDTRFGSFMVQEGTA